jgi:hypothetical protein
MRAALTTVFLTPLLLFAALWLLPYFDSHQLASAGRAAELRTAVTSVEAAIAEGGVPFETALVNNRTGVLGAYNGELHISGVDFEKIPFPDREAFLGRVGNAWCAALPRGFNLIARMASFRIHDLATGDKLGSYYCFAQMAVLG